MRSLQEVIGLEFVDAALLTQAFIHKSYLNEHRGELVQSNERLEYLGDAVLELSVTRALFDAMPDAPEGTMTSVRSALVRGDSLADTARALQLGDYLQLSVGEEASGGRDKDYILANTFEALIGAIYLDQGYDAADRFILQHIFSKLDGILEQKLHIDAKTEFQELAQAEVMVTPEYALLSEEGPDHSKAFTMGAYLNGVLVGQGVGSSKRKAQEEAARAALQSIEWDVLRETLIQVASS